MEYRHVSVLREETVQGLAIGSTGSDVQPSGIRFYVDGTLGGCGHTLRILQIMRQSGERGMVIGIDQDETAIRNAKEVLGQAGYRVAVEPWNDREENSEEKPDVVLIHDNFAHIHSVLDRIGIDKVHGFLLDLGVSSHQLDDGMRGFSYMQDAPLDMRMDRRNQLSAREIVNEYSKEELIRVIRDYGEEHWAVRIADFIVTERQKRPLETTFDLVRVIKEAIPKSARADGPHPAKRTFQAIRIEVNGELRILEQALRDMTDHLEKDGRFSVITFHSLEDRIVKQTFRSLENPCICPPQLPVCVCGRKQQLRVVSRKPLLPSPEELEENPRSRSAKLRIAQRV